MDAREETSGAGRGRGGAEQGSASVESAGLAALVALLLVAAVAAVAAGGEVGAGRDLARAIGRRISCAPRLPDACRHHPLVPAYGWPLARLARALAPAPLALPGPGGAPLVGVDFRRCRRPSCFVEIVYWLYRPGLGWEAVRRRATRADVEAAAHTRVLVRDDPALVPLETLPGRDHYEFPAAEEPPWRWRVPGRYPGWSS
jgi:hypothetical protein